MVSREEFLRYEEVRLSGKYNMITDNELARTMANLSAEKYLEIIKNYKMYKEMYLEG